LLSASRRGDHSLDVFGQNVELKVYQFAGLSCFQVCVTASVGNDPSDKAGRFDLSDR